MFSNSHNHDHGHPAAPEEILQSIDYKRYELSKLDFDSFWQIGEQTGQLLRDTVIRLNAKNVLELGSSSGYSGLWICEGLLKTGGHLYTVESHAERSQICRQTFEDANVAHMVTPIKDHAPEVFQRLPEPKYDLIFIDCTKKQTLEIFKLAAPRLNLGGAILIDNINSHRDQFADFFDYLAQKQIRYSILDMDAGLLLYQKN